MDGAGFTGSGGGITAPSFHLGRAPDLTEADVQQAFDYLLASCEPVAEAIADLDDAEEALKAAKASCALRSIERSWDARAAAALLEDDVRSARRRVRELRVIVETHRMKRRSAELLIEVWRSVNANNRALHKVA